MSRTELIVLVVIAAGVVTLALAERPVGRSAGGIPGRGKLAVAENRIVEIEKSVQLFYLDHDRFPATLEQLLEPTGDYPNGYILQLELDPWERPFRYAVVPGSECGFVIASDGEDGVPGTEDDITSETRRKGR